MSKEKVRQSFEGVKIEERDDEEKCMNCSGCGDQVDECLNCKTNFSDCDDIWCSEDGHFCSAECVANWYADETTANEDDDDEDS